MKRLHDVLTNKANKGYEFRYVHNNTNVYVITRIRNPWTNRRMKNSEFEFDTIPFFSHERQAGRNALLGFVEPKHALMRIEDLKEKKILSKNDVVSLRSANIQDWHRTSDATRQAFVVVLTGYCDIYTHEQKYEIALRWVDSDVNVKSMS